MNYAWLRSHGGQGINIKANFPDRSTPAGKRDRTIGYIIFAISIAGFAAVFTRKHHVGQLSAVLLPTIFGATAYFIYRIVNKKDGN